MTYHDYAIPILGIFGLFSILYVGATPLLVAQLRCATRVEKETNLREEEGVSRLQSAADDAPSMVSGGSGAGGSGIPGLNLQRDTNLVLFDGQPASEIGWNISGVKNAAASDLLNKELRLSDTGTALSHRHAVKSIGPDSGTTPHSLNAVNGGGR